MSGKIKIALKLQNQISDTTTQIDNVVQAIAPAKLPIKVKVHAPKSPTFALTGGLIDLKLYHINKMSQSTKKMTGKELVIDVMSQLVEHTQTIINAATAEDRKKHQFRMGQFQKAIETMRESPGDITSGAQAKQLKGIGKGIADRVDEIIQTGTLAELKTSVSIDEKTKILNELTSVTGIGDANAKKFYDAGIRSIADLIEKAKLGQIKLTHHMQVGLKYHDDFQLKIPFKEIAELGQTLKNCVAKIDPDLVIEICGSHRRKKDLSGDIDVLITHNKIKTEEDIMQSKESHLKKIVARLHEDKFLVDDLTSQGNTKFMGVCVHPQVNKGRRIDIRFVYYDAFFPALLYFTGSMTLNKLMRTLAIEKGYTLNEYGLYKFANGQKGEKVVALSEKAIFDHLGIIYLEPNEREF
jgi:DNA polymerase beta